MKNNKQSLLLIDECKKLRNLTKIQTLIKLGANINYQNEHKITAFHIACAKYHNINAIKYLIEHGADIELKNRDGNDALHIALKVEDNEKVINYLKLLY